MPLSIAAIELSNMGRHYRSHSRSGPRYVQSAAALPDWLILLQRMSRK